LGNHPWRQCSTKPCTMNTNKIISVFSIDLYMSQYKSYCIPSDLIEKIISVNNTLTIVNSSSSSVGTGHWLCIFQTAKSIEFFDSLGLSYKF
jgi:hypothetical protein